MLPPAPTRVLVVEDDQTIAGNLVEYLEATGHWTDVAHDGPAAIARIGAETFDVIVLELGLPRIDGLSVLKHLRDVLGIATPVLVLTARDQIASKRAGFDAGADDYVTKPFSLAEVLLRISALRRRATGAVAQDIMRAGPLRLDRRTRRAFVGDAPVRLMPRSLQLLELLMRDPGRVVTRLELEAGLWPADTPERDNLRSQVHILRRALTLAGFDGLETAPKIGYRLRCDSAADT